MQPISHDKQINKLQSNHVAIRGNSARNSSFELLRIIAMFSIVICHFATHGGFHFDSQELSASRFWWYFIEMGGNFGVNVFVLISGYFLIRTNSGLLDIKRILRFWGQVFFYSVVVYTVFGIAGVSEFSLKSFVQALLPIIHGRYWFASTYFVLFLLHPFLDIFLNKLDRKTYQKLLILLITIWCLIPTFTLSSFQSNNLLWFITLYCVAGYIRLYGLNLKFSTKHYVLLWLGLSILRYSSAVALIILGTKFSVFTENTLLFYETQSVLTFLNALFLFLAFKNINIGSHKWINIIASATFGVYLIHDNSIVRSFLWGTVFKNSDYQDSVLLIPYSIAAALLVFAVCTLIDLLRQVSVEKVFLMIINNKTPNIMKALKKVFNSLENSF